MIALHIPLKSSSFVYRRVSTSDVFETCTTFTKKLSTTRSALKKRRNDWTTSTHERINTTSGFEYSYTVSHQLVWRPSLSKVDSSTCLSPSFWDVSLAFFN